MAASTNTVEVTDQTFEEVVVEGSKERRSWSTCGPSGAGRAAS